MRTKLPADIPIESLTAIRDSREQNPFDLSPLKMIEGSLNCGDYSLQGLEHVVRIERKADDLISCCGVDRDMFMNQMDRLRGFPVRALVLEWSWSQIEMGQWRSKIRPASVIGTLLGLVESGIPVIAAGSHQRAAEYTAKLLYCTARRRWRESRSLIANLTEAAE